MSSSLNGKDYLSVAVLPDESQATLAFFRKYAFAHVRKTVVTWNYEEKIARLVSTYSAETDVKEGDEAGTIFALFRHQWPEAITPLTSYAYKSARGDMKVAAGASFSTGMIFNGILPAMPNLGNDPEKLKSLVAGAGGSVGGGDSYNSGKSMGRLAAMAQIAEFAGNTAKRQQFVNALEAGLESWLTAGGGQQLYYSKTWGALIGYPASFGSDQRLSDHHFHFGYWILAAGIVAQWDPDWAKKDKWGGMVEMLIREVNSWDEADPLFARFRYFDAYEGHGWADGVGFDRGNNQESSSESMNCTAGIILWGINTGNKAIRDMGIFMYVNEARAIEQYWWDVDKSVFPSGFNHNAVGMVWTNGGAYTTWFSQDKSSIHGINFLPITGGSLYLGRHPDHILKNYQEGFSGGWSDLFYEYLAFADADQAVSKYGNGVGSEAGESNVHTYHHLKSLQAVGRLNTLIGASVPSFAVFDKGVPAGGTGGTRTYTAFNPDDAAATVTFTDGFSMEVPGHAQISKQGPAMPIGILDRAGTARSRRASVPAVWNGIADPYGIFLRQGSPLYDIGGRRVRDMRNPNATGAAAAARNLPNGIYLTGGEGK
jgi:endoglucanase Acf2